MSAVFCNRIFSKRQYILEIVRRFSVEVLDTDQRKIWQSVVGLEVHAQINAKSKLFSSSPTSFGSPTNSQVSYFDAALPGTLPVLNKYCIEAAVITALSLNCNVHKFSKFDRKHYFYPDLPAGYQITQHFYPIATSGSIKFPVYDKHKQNNPYLCSTRVKQLQLEQDSGRTFHLKNQMSLVDLNRADVGLMEIVFEPDLQNGTEAAALVKELIQILKRINTCSCEMEEGALRVDANISVNKLGQPLGIRTEVKNINSLRYIARAIDFEIQRQIQILEEGGVVLNETRTFDHQSKTTIFMRDKEVFQDYRFMPEPNLPPIKLYESNSFTSDTPYLLDISALRKQMPSLPHDERTYLINQYKLSLETSDKLINVPGVIDKFEAIAEHVTDFISVSNFLLNNVLPILNKRKLSFTNSLLTAAQLEEIVLLIIAKSITEATANDTLEMLLNGDQRSAKEILDAYNWYLISDQKELEAHCLKVMEACPKVVKKYRNTRKQQYMTSLLKYLYENTNNRAPYKESQDTFIQLIFKQEKNV